jgi:hypothetical protein
LSGPYRYTCAICGPSSISMTITMTTTRAIITAYSSQPGSHFGSSTASPHLLVTTRHVISTALVPLKTGSLQREYVLNGESALCRYIGWFISRGSSSGWWPSHDGFFRYAADERRGIHKLGHRNEHDENGYADEGYLDQASHTRSFPQAQSSTSSVARHMQQLCDAHGCADRAPQIARRPDSLQSRLTRWLRESPAATGTVGQA